MKLTTAKTRKGIIQWLKAHNPWLSTEILDSTTQIIAISVYRDNGEIRAFLTQTGEIAPEHLYLYQIAA